MCHNVQNIDKCIEPTLATLMEKTLSAWSMNREEITRTILFGGTKRGQCTEASSWGRSAATISSASTLPTPPAPCNHGVCAVSQTVSQTPQKSESSAFCKKVLWVYETNSFASFGFLFRRRNLKVSQTRKTD